MVVTEKQSAADDAQSGGTEAASSGESELDTLLKEYETDRTTDTKSNGDVGRLVKGLQPVIEYARDRMVKDQNDAVKADLDNAFKFVTEQDELKSLKSSTVRGFLEAYGVDHPEFATAFQNRGKNPEAWTEALTKGRDWLREEFSGFSKSSDREDLEAAQAAVTGTTDQVPDAKDGKTPKEMFAMSDVAWESYMDAEIAKVD